MFNRQSKQDKYRDYEREIQSLKSRLEEYESEKYNPSPECEGCKNLIVQDGYNQYFGTMKLYFCRKNNTCADKEATQ